MMKGQGQKTQDAAGEKSAKARVCDECGHDMTTSLETHQYKECGLDYVTLEGVQISRCPNCGNFELAISGLEELHRTIAYALACMPVRLGPKEIRFLRKYLGLSSTDFAIKMGVELETLSRWERLDQPKPMSGSADRLLRHLVMSEKPVECYPFERTEFVDKKPDRMILTPREKGWQQQEARA